MRTRRFGLWGWMVVCGLTVATLNAQMMGIKPNIMVNGSPGPVTLTSSENATVSVALYPEGQFGTQADWWCVVCTPFPAPMNWVHVALGGRVVPGIAPSYQGPMFMLDSTVLLNLMLPPGAYTFYFGVDTLRNGVLNIGQNVFFYDSVSVTVTEDMTLIPAGSFAMGDAFSEGEIDEWPVHEVFVSGFYMSKKEVTKALWDDVYTWAVANGYSFANAGSGKTANHPVQTVGWYDAVKWCNARSQKDGLIPCYTVSGSVYKTGASAPDCNWTANGYRLPTEAEWEKAARGGLSGKRFPWGDTIMHSQANYCSSSSYSYDIGPTRGYHPTYTDRVYPYTSPVGSFGANGYGLYDMAGNVREWCWDWYGSSYYSGSPGTDPRGPVSGSYRVARGGSCYSYAMVCRSAFRNSRGLAPGDGYNDGGFRLVRAAP